MDHRAANGQVPQLELKLFALEPSFRAGDRVRLGVEVWNVGAEDVIIAQNLESSFGNSALSFILEADNGGESIGIIGDRPPEPGEPDFEQTFVTNWLTLNKNHYYGTHVDLDPTDFPYLRKPGRYVIHAQYYSRGISSTPGWNGSFLKQADVDKLPLKAFQGTLNSNDVSIRVIAPK